MKLISKVIGLAWVIQLLFCFRATAQSKWVVHEWGTFTSLQNEAGDTIGGINTDDEPVPQFVHRLAHFLLLQPTEVPAIFFQGAPSCHPDVTMRLETPVIYAHPPKSETNIKSASVRVKFRGGWLTEFYPYADPDAPGLKDSWSQFPHLRSDTESKLEWNNLKIGGDWPVTNTSAHVWTSPRAVQSALVQTTNGESEKFLFYRGVAHINAPLKISRDTNTDQLVFRGQLKMPTEKPFVISRIWLVDIQSARKIAFRSLPSLTLQTGSTKFLTLTPASFEPNDFASGNLIKLKIALQEALVSEGLFSDEAQALLNTWELSYFKSPGLRVFFIVPREWTDYYLPLQISQPAEINRVMVGRIELITPQQRKSLLEISRLSQQQIKLEAGQMYTNFYGKFTFNGIFGKTSKPSLQEMRLMNKEVAEVNAGRTSLASFITVPKGYQTYLALGRFRNALILDEAKRLTSLTNFISTYRLEAYKPVGDSGDSPKAD